MAIPKKDSALLQWANNADTRLTASPITFGVTSSQASAFHVVADAFATAYAAASAVGNRSKSLVSDKNAARTALLQNGREIYAYVQANTTVSAADKDLLGVVVRKTTTTPQPPPSSKPKVTVKGVSGWNVDILIQDAAGEGRRGRPPGTAGASIFSYSGTESPSAISAWKFEGNTGRNRATIAFATTIPGGSKVYITAFWFNNAKLNGPACEAVPVTLQGGGVMMESEAS